MTEPTVTTSQVHRLWLAGVVPPGRYLAALDLVRNATVWAVWGRRLVLALAVGQILAAVVFFFAYNWERLPGLFNIGATLAVLVACGIGAGLAPSPLVRRVLLIAAAMMTGVVLAVAGQHYQSGADAWQLFALWAGLILPWTLFCGSAVLWLLWGVVAQVAVGTAFATHAPPDLSPVVFAALPLAFVVARAVWPQVFARWLGLTALAGALVVLGVLSGIELVGGLRGDLPWGTAGLVLLAVYAWAVPWARGRDLAPLAMVACTGCLSLTAAVVWHIGDLFFGVVATVVLFAGGAAALNRLLRRPQP